jgi:hypothetical protein
VPAPRAEVLVGGVLVLVAAVRSYTRRGRPAGYAVAWAVEGPRHRLSGPDRERVAAALAEHAGGTHDGWYAALWPAGGLNRANGVTHVPGD